MRGLWIRAESRRNGAPRRGTAVTRFVLMGVAMGAVGENACVSWLPTPGLA
jgi:hypothetical protein